MTPITTRPDEMVWVNRGEAPLFSAAVEAVEELLEWVEELVELEVLAMMDELAGGVRGELLISMVEAATVLPVPSERVFQKKVESLDIISSFDSSWSSHSLPPVMVKNVEKIGAVGLLLATKRIALQNQNQDRKVIFSQKVFHVWKSRIRLTIERWRIS